MDRIIKLLDWITDSTRNLLIGTAGLLLAGTLLLLTFAALTTWFAGGIFWLTFGVGMASMIITATPGIAFALLTMLMDRPTPR